MEILSYLKPLQLYKQINILNKQFNQNINTMIKTEKYYYLFCNDNFVFDSFKSVQKIC